MNLTQAKKLAKNLREAWPALVAEHGSKLALHDAQELIARIQGYPHWHAFQQSGLRPKEPERGPFDGSLQANLAFVPLGPPGPLPTRYNPDTDEWTHRVTGVEVALRPLSENADTLMNQVDEALYAELERGGCWNGEYPSDPAELRQLVRRARHAVSRCPFCIEAINVLAGLLYSLGAYDESMSVAEPGATMLLAMVPTNHTRVQVPYGFLKNRPFFRLCYVYLLLLDRAGRHKEANALAKRMHRYCPSDNMGFRYLTTVSGRLENLPG